MSTGFPKPVETGKEYTVDIIGIGRSGDGIASTGLCDFCKKCKSRRQKLKD